MNRFNMNLNLCVKERMFHMGDHFFAWNSRATSSISTQFNLKNLCWDLGLEVDTFPIRNPIREELLTVRALLTKVINGKLGKQCFVVTHDKPKMVSWLSLLLEMIRSRLLRKKKSFWINYRATWYPSFKETKPIQGILPAHHKTQFSTSSS